MIREPAAGILIDRIEEIFDGSKQANDGCTGAESFKVLGKKLLPKFLAQAKKKYSGGSNGYVSFETEVVG